jgi:hypothetical protein
MKYEMDRPDLMKKVAVGHRRVLQSARRHVGSNE